jgi:predicted transcriptional regulator
VAETPRKLIVSVVPIEQMKDFSIATTRERVAAQDAGLHAPAARRVFATEELLWSCLTPKRLALLKAIGGRGPMSIREAARLAGRDVKAVHGEVQKMLERRLIEKTEDGRIEFPYEEIHLDVVLKSSQAAA